MNIQIYQTIFDLELRYTRTNINKGKQLLNVIKDFTKIFSHLLLMEYTKVVVLFKYGDLKK